MRRRLYWALAVGFFLLQAGSALGVIVDRVLAVVNGEVITLSELQEVEYSLRQGGGSGKKRLPEDKAKLEKELLERLIERKLQLQLAERKGLVVPKEQVDAALEDLIKQNKLAGPEELERMLAKQGLTLEDLRRQLEEQIKLTKLVNSEVRAKIVVTQEEIEAYYKKHAAEFAGREEVHARHILFPLPEDAKPADVAAAEKLAEQVLARLAEGADFEGLLAEFGKYGAGGGDLGFFTRGQLIPELEEVVWELAPGEYRRVRTRFGVHVVQVLERRKHTLENDARIAEEIKQRIYQEKFERQYKAWLEDLRRQAAIKVNL